MMKKILAVFLLLAVSQSAFADDPNIIYPNALFTNTRLMFSLNQMRQYHFMASTSPDHLTADALFVNPSRSVLYVYVLPFEKHILFHGQDTGLFYHFDFATQQVFIEGTPRLAFNDIPLQLWGENVYGEYPTPITFHLSTSGEILPYLDGFDVPTAMVGTQYSQHFKDIVEAGVGELATCEPQVDAMSGFSVACHIDHEHASIDVSGMPSVSTAASRVEVTVMASNTIAPQKNQTLKFYIPVMSRTSILQCPDATDSQVIMRQKDVYVKDAAGDMIHFTGTGYRYKGMKNLQFIAEAAIVNDNQLRCRYYALIIPYTLDYDYELVSDVLTQGITAITHEGQWWQESACLIWRHGPISSGAHCQVEVNRWIPK